MVATYRLVRPQRTAAAVPVLDAAQQQVVEHTGRPMVVLAGPGTGKTTTLVEAAAARVAAGVPVEQILMLTFGRRAAGELRDRLTTRLARTVREPIARTFHSYAFGVLRMASVADGLPAPRLLSGPEQDVILRELVAGDLVGERSPWPAEIAPALSTRAFAGELRDLLLRAVERGLSGAELSALGKARGRPDWVAAGAMLTQYHDVIALGRPGAYDPAELIQAALGSLHADPELLAAERRRRRRIFVDEYQDTDPAQAELLELLADGADELLIVGDPDQSIYGFRGADTAAMRDAPGRFGADQVIALGTSRRSGATLLDATRRVAAQLPGPAGQRRLAPAGGAAPGRVEVSVLRSATEEAGYLAGLLRGAHLEEQLPWDRMAVIVRSTSTTLPILRRALTGAGIPVTVRGEDLPLPDQPAVAHVVTALRCVLDPGELTDAVAEQLLLGPIGHADPLLLRQLGRELRRLSRALGEPEDGPLLANAVNDRPGAALLPGRLGRPVERVATVLAAGRDALTTAGSTPEDVLWAIWSATGLAAVWERQSAAGGAAGAAADRDLDSVLELFNAAARFTDRLPSASMRQFLDQLAALQVPGDTVAGERGDGVQILTAHASKGLEWDLVCVAGVQEGSWPNLRLRGSLLGSELLVDVIAGRDVATENIRGPVLAEERRLFYVAITRARRRLVVTAVLGDDEQPSRFLDEVDPLEPGAERPLRRAARGIHLPGLVAELRAAVTDPALGAQVRSDAAIELARLAAADVPGAHPDDWWGLAELSADGPVAAPELPVRIRPSGIQTYLDCELHALLGDFGARDGVAIAQTLGTLVHEVAAAAPEDASLETLEAMLDARWTTLDFGAQWYSRNERVRARSFLTRLVSWLHESRTELELVAIEEPFRVAVDTGSTSVEIAGAVDRLERDRSGALVVVDLKTGRGKVRDEELPVHPQLGAYQFAVEHGAFAAGHRAGGARLVQLGATVKQIEQAQPPLESGDDPDWIRRQLDQVATRLRGAQFSATVNGRCGNCDVAACCPLMPNGKQVTQ